MRTRNKPLKGLTKHSPFKTTPPNAVRKDSTVTYNQDTLMVDSTPVGHNMGTKSSGYGWGAAIKSGSQPASMVKTMQDSHATNIVTQQNKKLSEHSTPGSGGMRPIMLGE